MDPARQVRPLPTVSSTSPPRIRADVMTSQRPPSRSRELRRPITKIVSGVHPLVTCSLRRSRARGGRGRPPRRPGRRRRRAVAPGSEIVRRVGAEVAEHIFAPVPVDLAEHVQVRDLPGCDHTGLIRPGDLSREPGQVLEDEVSAGDAYPGVPVGQLIHDVQPGPMRPCRARGCRTVVACAGH
jgi:hypothetical protein